MNLPNLMKLDLAWFNKKKVLLLSILLLIGIAWLSAAARMSTMSSPTVLDYDPFWHYRHAKEIVENNMQVPAWDELSFYPPGRPTERAEGWEYMIAIFYKIAEFLDSSVSFDYVAKLSPVIMVILATIPAYLLGKELSNEWGGLLTALFAVLTPTFIGISMAGYCDSDAVVVFYMFLCVYSILMALKKRTIPYYTFAIITNLMFIYTWTGWIVFMFFIAFIPALVVFRFIEEIIKQRKLKLDMNELKSDFKLLIIPIIIIVVVTNVISYFIGLGSIVSAIPMALSFSGIVGQPMLVNISVAELQLLDVFSQSGFMALADKIGVAPVVLTMFGLPAIVVYKLYKKERINFMEIFLFLWWLVTFYLITRGLRFSLLFSVAAATSAGYVIGNLIGHMKKNTIGVGALGIIGLLVVMFVSSAVQASYALGGMEIDQNWYDVLNWLKTNADKNSLIATWWDPGHIITGYTGLRVHADGAHCGPGQCIPYNHNIRIQDMGRIMSTDNETEAVTLLSKYRQLTPEQCKEVRDTFGSKVPTDACGSVSDIYVIASSDLIGKYYWMSYFGDCLKQYGLADSDFCYNSIDWFESNAVGKNFIQLSFSQRDTYGNFVYGGIVTLTEQNGNLVALLNIPEQGIRNVIIREIVYFQNGEEKRVKYNDTNAIDGMLWVDPGFGSVIFMEPSVRDSLFTKMFFFNGQGLNDFKLVYSNSEIKVYKVKF